MSRHYDTSPSISPPRKRSRFSPTSWLEEMVSQLETLVSSHPTNISNILAANWGLSPISTPQPRHTSSHYASLPCQSAHLFPTCSMGSQGWTWACLLWSQT
ncbi:hypothetical protein Pcinc_010188 [Petrolisthes cinctipes]|uniref:Uncharacterized protein n=1 Tax=Petrolisthes cinctipes TaxID=88211 RepID=A0AAE1G580_PETCI|nr:hypothetical protein Pcinc_010188 [Petrolisthes cinctipes]